MRTMIVLLRKVGIATKIGIDAPHIRVYSTLSRTKYIGCISGRHTTYGDYKLSGMSSEVKTSTSLHMRRNGINDF